MNVAGLLVRLIALIGGVLLTLLGLLWARSEQVTLGLLCALGGIVLYIWASSQIQPDDFSKVSQVSKPHLAWALLALFSVSCTLLVIHWTTPPQVARFSNYAADLLWPLSIILILVAAHVFEAPTKRGIESFNLWWRSHWIDLLVLLGILIVATLARVAALPDHPYPWSGDEASVGIEGRRILDAEVTNFFDTGWSGQPNWSFFPTALSLKIFGNDIFGVRMASAIPGILAVLFVFLLGRELFSRAVGTLAALFLALYPLHVHFSRIGVNNIYDSFLVCLVLWLLFRAVRRGGSLDFALAGCAAGLCLYTYVGTRLVLLLSLGFLIATAISSHTFLRSKWRQLAWFAAGLLITAAPMACYFILHPDIFMGRIGQEGILFNGWLVSHAQEIGQSIWHVLLDQTARSVLVFIANGAPSNFFNSPQPYLTLVGSFLFLVGMVLSVVNLRKSSYAALLIWFWAVVVLGGILTLNPPSNTRMLMTTPAVALFVALGLQQTRDLLDRIRIAPRVSMALAAAVILFLSIENGYFYFVDYRNKSYFQDASAELVQETGLQVQALGPTYTLYLFGDPRVYTDFPTFRFLIPENEKHDLSAESLSALAPKTGQGMLFAFIPENRDLLTNVRSLFPGGTLGTFARKIPQSEVLYYFYALAPN